MLTLEAITSFCIFNSNIGVEANKEVNFAQKVDCQIR